MVRISARDTQEASLRLPAGSAPLKQLTGAKYVVVDADVPMVESGGKQAFFYGSDPRALYPPKSTASCTMATK
jgi:hypothetical protein